MMEHGLPFKLPPMSTADINKAWAEFADDHPVFDPKAARWLAPYIKRLDKEGLGLGTVMTQIRAAGRTLSAEEKRALGIDVRLKFTAEMADVLTPAGRAQASEAFTAILLKPLRVRRRGIDRMRALENDWPVRFSAVEDKGTCAPALAMHGRVHASKDAPRIPMLGCDKLHCRCANAPIPPSLAARRDPSWSPDNPSPSEPDASLLPATPSMPVEKGPPAASGDKDFLGALAVLLLVIVALAVFVIATGP